MGVAGACARRTCALVAGLGQGLVRRWAARPRVLRPIWRSGSFGPAVLGSRCVDVARPCQQSLVRTTRRRRVARASRTRRHRVAQRLENAQLPENFVPLDATEWHARRALDATEWRGGVASSRGCVQLKLRPAPVIPSGFAGLLRVVGPSTRYRSCSPNRAP